MRRVLETKSFCIPVSVAPESRETRAAKPCSIFYECVLFFVFSKRFCLFLFGCALSGFRCDEKFGGRVIAGAAKKARHLSAHFGR